MRVIVLSILLLTAGISLADIINIPEDHETIQGGMDAAEDGDTVLVQPGTYVENIIFDHKGITVGSLTLMTDDRVYIDSTIIDGDEQSCVVAFLDYTHLDSLQGQSRPVLRGFTIRNGLQNYGGGIDCQLHSRPVLQDLLITDNTAVQGGGGICTSSESFGHIRHFAKL